MVKTRSKVDGLDDDDDASDYDEEYLPCHREDVLFDLQRSEADSCGARASGVAAQLLVARPGPNRPTVHAHARQPA